MTLDEYEANGRADRAWRASRADPTPLLPGAWLCIWHPTPTGWWGVVMSLN